LTEVPKTLREHFNADIFFADSNIGVSLETELSNNPSKLAYYNAQAAYWGKEADRLKALKDVQWSQAFIEAKGDGLKPPPVELRKAIAETNPAFIATTQNYLDAKEQHKLFEQAVETLSQKQFSLGSLNSRERREMDIGSPTSPTRSSPEERTERRARVLDAQG
jgi:hypothetical protein